MNDQHGLLTADIIGRNIKGCQVFMSKQNSDVYTLNETASFIFTCLGPTVSLAEVESRVMKEFEIDDPASVRQDVLNLLTTLLEKKILHPAAVAHLVPGGR
jgi:hypothetical protein